MNREPNPDTVSVWLPQGVVSKKTYIVESTGILRDDIERSAQRAKRPSVETMTVRSAVHLGPCLMDSRVDHKCSGIQHSILSTRNDLAMVVDLN